jgi:putative (di)nucleoside polyphosphate hydrolase
MPTKILQKLRPNVCMLVVNADGKLFLGERLGRPGHWQFPQGGVEPGETLRENVIRELREEIGIQRKHIGTITKLSSRNRYLWKKIPAYAEGRWVGQSQTFWLVEFIGSDEDIDLHSSAEAEFKRWRWCSVSRVQKLAARERIEGYAGALSEFVELQNKLRKKTPRRKKLGYKKPRLSKPKQNRAK